jgi:iron complex outermembrane receptor protein
MQIRVASSRDGVIGGISRRAQWLSCISAVALGLAWTAPATAQDAADQAKSTDTAAKNNSAQNTGANDTGALNQIVVTAQFRAQPLQDVPIAITAVSSDELEQRSVKSIVDLADSVPNVEMTTGGSGYGAQTNQAFIRGLGQVDFLAAFEPRVGFYVDDVYYATTFGSVFDTLDLERVEVLRGPQGTLFGRNSVGGALRLITKKPTGDNSGYIEATGGSRNYYQLRGAYDLGLTDTLALRLVGSAKGQDGQVKRLNYKCVYPQYGNAEVGGPSLHAQGKDNCKIGTLGGGSSYAFRGTLGWEASPSVKVYLAGDYTHERSESSAEVILATQTSLINPYTGALGGAIPVGGPDNNGLAKWLRGIGTSYYGFDVSTPDKMQQVVDSFVSPGRYSTFARYGNQRVGYSNPPEGTLDAWGGSLTVNADLASEMHLTSITAYRHYKGDFGQSLLAVPVEEVRNGMTHRQWSQELRLLGSVFDNVLDYTLGAYYLDTRTLNPARVQTEGFIQALDFFSDDVATLRSWALFGAVDIHPVPKLTLSGGLRYSDEKKTYTFNRDYSPSGLGFLNFIATGRNHDSEFNPRLSINYEVNHDVNVYASYATGFTASAFNARPFGASGIFALEPEKVKTYEVGLKSMLFNRVLRFNTAAYFTRFDNLVGTLRDPTYRNGACAIFCNANVGNADIKGFEIEAEARPTHELMLSTSLGYTDFKYKELLAATQGLTLDSPQARVPKWTLSGAMQYDAPIADGQFLTPRIDVSYRSRTYFANDITDVAAQQPGYALVNLRLTYRNDNLGMSIAGAVTNVFNQYYYTTITDQLESFGFLSASVGRPREWSITLRKKF